MGLKYGQQFQKEFRHYTILQTKLNKSLHLGSKLIQAIRAQTPLQQQLIPLIELLLELNMSTTLCFRNGYTSSGLLILRQIQEITHKMWAMHHKPKLAEKNKVTPSEVRKVMRDNGFPDWSECYKSLCSVAHADQSYLLNILPVIGLNEKVSAESKMTIEYYLMILNHLNQKVLFVTFKSVKKAIGSDYSQLVQLYNDTEWIVINDWEKVNKKNIEVFGK